MWLIILLFSLAILHCIYLLCKISIKTKKEATKRAIYDKNKILEYVCPKCGRTIPLCNVLNWGNDRCWYACSSCGSSGDIKLSKLEKFKNVIPLDDIIDKIPNKDSIKDWDLSSAKDVEFTKVTESFNRKTDLD
jgi:predicted RNA-binding Zn-ribbon protein involved in translation (DUF1610 family)